jgi:hypothetical protein
MQKAAKAASPPIMVTNSSSRLDTGTSHPPGRPLAIVGFSRRADGGENGVVLPEAASSAAAWVPLTNVVTAFGEARINVFDFHRVRRRPTTPRWEQEQGRASLRASLGAAHLHANATQINATAVEGNLGGFCVWPNAREETAPARPQVAVLSFSNAELFSRLRSRSPEAACSRICSATSSGVTVFRIKKR